MKSKEMIEWKEISDGYSAREHNYTLDLIKTESYDEKYLVDVSCSGKHIGYIDNLPLESAKAAAIKVMEKHKAGEIEK